VLILTDILGDGSMSTSAASLNQTGLHWFLDNQDRMDRLLISRGLILGGNRTAVEVQVAYNEAALSYLQLMLTVVPGLFALAAWIMTLFEPMGYYKNSFLAAVCVTTHIIPGSKGNDIGYMRVPPEITLRTIDDHVRIETPSGVLTNGDAEKAVPVVQ